MSMNMAYYGLKMHQSMERILTKKLLLSSLSGLAPVHCSYKDKWGWGNSGTYTTAKGFMELQKTPHESCLFPTIWKSVTPRF